MKNKSLIFQAFLFFLIFNICLSSGFSADSKWTVASEPFVLKQESKSPAMNNAAKTLPVLILEQLNDNVERIPDSKELLNRKLYELQKERVSLFLQLSKEVQTRDAIFLNNYSKGTLNRKLKASDKSIAKIEEKIRTNLKNVDDLKKEYEPKIKREEENRRRREAGEEELKTSTGFFDFFSSYSAPVIEKIVLFKNDFRQLYSDLKSDNSTDYTISGTEKKIVDAGINCLITGKITAFNDFISCTITLYEYPGSRVIGYVTDVGSLSDLNSLAQDLASAIAPKIMDSLPVELSIKIYPEEIAKKVTFSIDGSVYKNNFDKIVLSSGAHTLQFNAEGYNSISTTYSFSGDRMFAVDVNMTEKNEGSVNLRFTKMYEGNIYYNGVFSNPITPENRISRITINGRTVLGHFINKDGQTSDFFIPNQLLVDGNELVVNTNPFDRSKYIDARRKWMYGSYSILIVSLMPYFFCYGNYYSAATAYNNRYTNDRSTAERWQMASNITGGISIGCAAFFVYELVRYFLAANTVLPDNAKKLSPSQKKKLEKKAAAELLKIEKQKALELEKAEKAEKEKNIIAENKSEKSEITENNNNNNKHDTNEKKKDE